MKRLSFALFDSGETILSALVFSTFFPLYITKFIDTKVYSALYGSAFLLSFFLALYLGWLADRSSRRKPFFVAFSLFATLFCFLIAVFYVHPYLALASFLLLAVSHQQAFVFYNTLLLNFETKGFASGFGVAMGYVASAIALVFLARHLQEPEVYWIVALIFLSLFLPSALKLPNPVTSGSVSLRTVLKDRGFLLFIVCLLTMTEVANTLVAMMGVYLREVYGMAREEIFRVIGLSAIGGVMGGILWGFLVDRFGAGRVFPVGFFLWGSILALLPFVPSEMILAVGLAFGTALAHLWTTGRVYILSRFETATASVRLSFLSLTERIASTTGLLVWSLLLFVTGDNYRLSAGLMAIFPLTGALLYFGFISPPRRLFSQRRGSSR